MLTKRLWFTKTGEAAYISLLDLQRVMQRAFKRAHVPAWYTLGFNPHIYMTFTAPLSLGQESLVESLDFKTEQEDCDWNAVCARLNDCLPRGIEALRIVPVGMNPSLLALARYTLRYAPQRTEEALAVWNSYAQLETAQVEKKGKRGKVTTVDLKPLAVVEDVAQTQEGLCVSLLLPAGSELNINPMLLLGFLEREYGLSPASCDILRTDLLTAEKTIFQ